MISAEQFLKLLQEKDLLPIEMVKKLRHQVANSPKPVPATAIAKLLIEKGYLTRPLAKRLLATPGEAEQTAATKPATETPRKTETEEELGFASSYDVKPAVDDTELEIVETDDMAAPIPATPIEEAPVAAEPIEGEVVMGDVMADHEPGFSGVEDAGTALPTKRKGMLGKILPARDRRRKANVWDSSLILVGGGALTMLVILAGVFIWVFWGTTGDAMVEAAHKDYQNGAYRNAISKYDEFVKKFPKHPQASEARVRRGLARMRNVYEGATDYDHALTITVEVLGEISPEKNFGDARDELRSLLPNLAEGLAKQAHEKTSLEYVNKTRQALALVEKHISKSKRPVTRLEDINSSLAMTVRRIERDDELAKAVAAMLKALEAGNTPQAYTIRRALLKEYPDLIDSEDLHKAVLAITEAEKKDVKSVVKEKMAQSEEPSVEVRPAVCIARKTLHKEVRGVKGEIVFAVASGAVYGINAADGTVLWRRHVGYHSNAQRENFPLVPVSNRPGSDTLLVEKKTQSLMRVEACTGKIKWRHQLGERFDTKPIIDGSRVLVATDSGRLVDIDLTTGDSTGYIQLPQKLNVSPVIDKKRSRIYQLAEHSNLYVLSSRDGKCERVLYLGHEAGSVSATPVIIGKYLVVAENRGANSVVLRILSLESEDEKPAPFVIQKIDLEGHVDISPVVYDARMLLITDTGRVSAFRISASNATRPLEKIGQLQTSTAANLIRYPLLVREQFWVADEHLTKFEIQASLSTLKRKWIACKDSAFLQPLRAGGDCIFSVRRRLDLPGVIISAVGMNRPEIFWETHLAVGPATEPTVDEAKTKLTLVTKLGSIVEVPISEPNQAEESIIDNPLVAQDADEIQRPVDVVVRTEGGSLALSTGRGSEQLAVFNPEARPIKFRPMVLPAALAARPIAFGDGLLVPSTIGQVFNLDLRGNQLLEPFQPKLGGDYRPEWQNPVDTGSDSALIYDGRRMLYRIGVRQQPKPHLAALDELELEARLVSSLAVVGQTAFALDERKLLLPIALPKLTLGKTQTIEGKCIWGPVAVGDHLLMATDNDKMLCFDAEGKPVWTVALLYGKPAGQPLLLDGDFIFSSVEGVVWRVDAASGKELAKIETGYPLTVGAVLLGDKLVLSGHDGTLYLVDQPQ